MVAVKAAGSGAGYSLTGLVESPPAIEFAIDDRLNAGVPGSGANLGAGVHVGVFRLEQDQQRRFAIRPARAIARHARGN